MFLKALCVKIIRETVTRHNYSRWRRPGNLKVEISDCKIHFFDTNTFFLRKLSSKFVRFKIIH